jgi:hypothetical protein
VKGGIVRGVRKFSDLKVAKGGRRNGDIIEIIHGVYYEYQPASTFCYILYQYSRRLTEFQRWKRKQ